MDIGTHTITLNSLFAKGLSGTLTLAELQARFPDANGNSLLNLLYNDLEEAVIHSPSNPQGNETDMKIFSTLREFGVLVCDLFFLQRNFVDEDWEKTRELILSKCEDYSRETLEVLLWEYISKSQK